MSTGFKNLIDKECTVKHIALVVGWWFTFYLVIFSNCIMFQVSWWIWIHWAQGREEHCCEEHKGNPGKHDDQTSVSGTLGPSCHHMVRLDICNNSQKTTTVWQRNSLYVDQRCPNYPGRAGVHSKHVAQPPYRPRSTEYAGKIRCGFITFNPKSHLIS